MLIMLFFFFGKVALLLADFWKSCILKKVREGGREGGREGWLADFWKSCILRGVREGGREGGREGC